MNVVKDVVGAVAKNAPIAISLVTVVSAFILSLVYLGQLNEANLQTQMTELSVNFGKLLEENREHEYRIKSLEQQVAVLTEEKKNLLEENKTLKHKVDSLNREIDSYRETGVIKRRG